MKLALNIVRPLAILLILGLASWLLYEELKDLHFHDLVEDLQATRPSQVAIAIGLTALNYVFLLGYDWLAIRYIGHPLPLGKLAVASFIGHVFSFNLGGIAGGSSMRYRIYSAWKFSMLEIVQLVAILGLTFWLGVLALAGIDGEQFDLRFLQPERLREKLGDRLVGFALFRHLGDRDFQRSAKLASDGIAESPEDVNTVLTSGFHHLYGPFNEYVQQPKFLRGGSGSEPGTWT